MVDMTYAPDSLRQINNVLSTLATGIRVCSWLLSDSDSEDAENWSLIISSALRHAFVSICGFAHLTRSLRVETLIDVYPKSYINKRNHWGVLTAVNRKSADLAIFNQSWKGQFR